MATLLYIWVLSQGQLRLEGKPESYYTLEACNAAARKAENARLLFEGAMTDDQIRAYCSPKRLGKDEEK